MGQRFRILPTSLLIAAAFHLDKLKIVLDLFMEIFLKTVLAVIPFFGFLVSSQALELGSKIPDIEAKDQDNKVVNLGKLEKDNFVLIYFYPKADTPGCTAQACNLRDNISELQKQGVKVIRVSTDKVQGQKNFQSKYHLPFILIADEKGDLRKVFGVPSLPILGFAKRQSFLFHKGKLVWVDREANPKTHAQDVLKAIEKLN